MFRPWNLFHKPDKFLKALLDTRGDPGFLVTDAEILHRLRLMRIKHRLRQPFDFIWRFIHGRYRRAHEKIHRRSDQASGAGPRATSATGSGPTLPVPPGASVAIPITRLSSPIFSAAVAITPGQGAGGGAMQTAFTTFAPPGFHYTPEDIPDAGVRTGEIVAYRCWRLNVFDDLTSVYMDKTIWPRNEPLRASGVDFKLYHGIHAFKDFLDMYAYAQSYFRCSRVIVTGKVELWGQVIEHEHGYLAEFAAVHSIDDSPHYDADTIRKAYGLKLPRKKKST